MIELVTTSGMFVLDGQEWEVENNVWLVGDASEVIVVDAAHHHEPIAAAVAEDIRWRSSPRTATTTTSTLLWRSDRSSGLPSSCILPTYCSGARCTPRRSLTVRWVTMTCCVPAASR